MSRQRDTKAEYAARDARARALGYRSNRDRTEARRAARAGAPARLKAEDRPTGVVARLVGAGRVKVGDAIRTVPPRSAGSKAHALPKFWTTPAAPGSQAMNSNDARAIVSRLEQAADRGEYVSIRATYQNRQGEWRTRQLDGYTEPLSTFLHGGGSEGSADSEGDGRRSFSQTSKIQLLFTDTRAKQGPNGGISASDLYDSWLDYEGDFWDWLYDAIDSEY